MGRRVSAGMAVVSTHARTHTGGTRSRFSVHGQQRPAASTLTPSKYGVIGTLPSAVSWPRTVMREARNPAGTAQWLREWYGIARHHSRSPLFCRFDRREIGVAVDRFFAKMFA